VLASIMLFWVSEDFLWFVCNPACGLARFNPAEVPWHKHWWLGAPTDYWLSLSVAAVMLGYSFKGRRQA
jgi:hypothetical protein